MRKDSFGEYQNFLRQFKHYRTRPCDYYTIGLAEEVGEVCALVKRKEHRGEHNPDFFKEMTEELGDVLAYVALLAEYYNLSLTTIAAANCAKVTSRYPAPLTATDMNP